MERFGNDVVGVFAPFAFDPIKLGCGRAHGAAVPVGGIPADDSACGAPELAHDVLVPPSIASAPDMVCIVGSGVGVL